MFFLFVRWCLYYLNLRWCDLLLFRLKTQFQVSVFSKMGVVFIIQIFAKMAILINPVCKFAGLKDIYIYISILMQIYPYWCNFYTCLPAVRLLSMISVFIVYICHQCIIPGYNSIYNNFKVVHYFSKGKKSSTKKSVCHLISNIGVYVFCATVY